MRIPHVAKPTAIGLWLHTDVWGRREMIPQLIAADIYPGEAATEMVEDHLLMLDEAGFLKIYQAEGSDWIQLTSPLKADRRTAPESDCPPPPQDLSRHVMAVGGARARAGEREARERVERAAEWAQWEYEQERTAPPKRPMLLDAPPIGCPDHPHGRFKDCGPCGTARRRHDRWVAQQRYTEELEDYEQDKERDGDERGYYDEEPF